MPFTAILKRRWRAAAAIGSLLVVVLFALVAGGCADTSYASMKANRRPLARYDTYYVPDYYPYYPWDGYYGGAYYYDY